MQPFLFIHIFIFFLICLSNCTRYRNKRRYCANKSKMYNEPDKEKTSEISEECKFYDPGEVDNHLLSQQCSYDYKFSSGTVINPYEDSQKFKDEYGDGVTFKSACLKCAACLAIAENINKTFTDCYYEKQTSNTPDDGNYDCQGLQNLCQNGFKNYDLRELNGTRLITRATTHSKHVNSKMDGSWTKLLRNLCCTYVDHLNLNEIFHRFKSGTINFSDFLCNGDGIFRDCKNLEVKTIDVPQERKQFSVRVCVNCF